MLELALLLLPLLGTFGVALACLCSIEASPQGRGDNRALLKGWRRALL